MLCPDRAHPVFRHCHSNANHPVPVGRGQGHAQRDADNRREPGKVPPPLHPCQGSPSPGCLMSGARSLPRGRKQMCRLAPRVDSHLVWSGTWKRGSSPMGLLWAPGSVAKTATSVPGLTTASQGKAWRPGLCWWQLGLEVGERGQGPVDLRSAASRAPGSSRLLTGPPQPRLPPLPQPAVPGGATASSVPCHLQRQEGWLRQAKSLEEGLASFAYIRPARSCPRPAQPCTGLAAGPQLCCYGVTGATECGHEGGREPTEPLSGHLDLDLK